MGILNKVFGKKQPNTIPFDNDEEHAVIVHFKYGKKDLEPIFELEDELGKAIDKAKVGEYDGKDIAADLTDGTLYMYGPDADQIFAVVQPILKDKDFMQGATVNIRYGPPEDGVEGKEIKIGS